MKNGRTGRAIAIAVISALSSTVFAIAPAESAPSVFTDLVGFANKTGFRGVFAWQASQQVVGLVHYGTAPNALTLTATQNPGPSPDTAAMAVVEDLVPGSTYYWQVEDLLTSERSIIKSFAATNAYTDWNGSTYTIDLLVQLDSQSLPPDVPFDLALKNLAQGMNVFAERLYDALDGYARLGTVLVTDTNLDYGANTPFIGPPECQATGGNLSDVLVQTSVPFDSHTFGGWAIDDPCTSFYIGRVGQLVVPWGIAVDEDLHFGAVAAHELAHYAFNTPDLYDPADIEQSEPDFSDSTPWCKNLAWDGSLMHNTGGYNGGRWELTELDRNPTLTPCDHADEVYSWDALRTPADGGRYLNIPLRPNGPIDHIVDTKARGNEDGGALDIRVLDREPGTSTLTPFPPFDGLAPNCSNVAPQVVDAKGDATGAAVVEEGVTPNEPSLDVLKAHLTWDAPNEAITFRIEVDDLGPGSPSGGTGHLFRFFFTYAGTDYQLQLRREGSALAFSLRLPDNTLIKGDLAGNFDAVTDEISVILPTKAKLAAPIPPNAPVWSPGAQVSGFEVLAQRLSGGSLTADTARGVCLYKIGQELLPDSLPPVATDDDAVTQEDTPVLVDALANDTDPENDELSILEVTTPASGSAVITPGAKIEYTPNPNFHGDDFFQYVIADPSGGVDTGRVDITVTPVPDTAVAVDDSATTTQGTPVEIDVIANDFDPEGDPFTFQGHGSPLSGSVTCTSAGLCTYTPNSGFSGVDSFTYAISDGVGGSDSATVTVTVVPPSCITLFFDNIEGDPDLDEDNVFTRGWTQDVTTGALTLSWYPHTDPQAKSPVRSWFTDASDVKTGWVRPPNQLVLGSTELMFWHRFSFEADFDGGRLEVSIDNGDTWEPLDPALITVGGYSGVLPATNPIGEGPGWTGDSPGFPDEMTLVKVDMGPFSGRSLAVRWRMGTDENIPGVGWWIDDVSFTNVLTADCVLPVNQPPFAVNDSVSTPEDSPVDIAVLANDTDPNDDNLTVTHVTQPSHGTAAVGSNGVVTYTPNLNFNGTDAFSYGVSDGRGGTEEATVTVTVTPVNDAPTALDDQAELAEDTTTVIPVLANDHDVDGDPLTVSMGVQAENGVATANGDGTITYKPNPNFHGTDRFGYVINDGAGGTDTAVVNLLVGDVIEPIGYSAVVPFRILDTRDGTGGNSGKVGPGETIQLQVAGRGALPSGGISSVVMNVTVEFPTASGHLTVFPSGAPKPTASNLNFTPGVTVANQVVVKVGEDGKVAFYNSAGSTSIIADVAGWFSDGQMPISGGASVARAPVRILDTRDGTGGISTPLGQGESIDLKVTGANGVPEGASAVVLNVTVDGPTDAGYLTVYPTSDLLPLASNINFDPGETVPNLVFVRVGEGGKIRFFNSGGSTNVVADLAGWFTDPGGAFTALAPERLLDTRDGLGAAAAPVGPGESIDVQVTGEGGVPLGGVSSVIVNVTAIDPSAQGYVTVYPNGTSQPLASNLNFVAGQTVPNLVLVKVGEGGKITLYNSSARSIHLAADVAGWFAS